MTLTTTQRPPDGDGGSEALDYNRLEQPWRDWAKIARNFTFQLEEQWDREDLMHNILLRLYEVAEEYRRQGKPLTKGGAIKVAQYTRLRFYHQKKRWGRVSSVSLNSVVRDSDGDETELIQTIPDRKGIDPAVLLDAKDHYRKSSKRVKKAIQKLLGEGDAHRLNGYDWKLIKRFRDEFKEKALV